MKHAPNLIRATAHAPDLGAREHFAGLMMQALVLNPAKAQSPGYADTARQAVKMADALINELKGSAL